MTDDNKGPFSVIGVGAAACLACCAPLVLGFIGSLGIAGLASTLFVGVGGLAIAALAVAAFAVVRRRKANCATPHEPVPVAAPQRRKPESDTTPTEEQLLP